QPPLDPTPFPYTTLFRSRAVRVRIAQILCLDALDRLLARRRGGRLRVPLVLVRAREREEDLERLALLARPALLGVVGKQVQRRRDRKSTRLNSSHDQISY